MNTLVSTAAAALFAAAGSAAPTVLSTGLSAEIWDIDNNTVDALQLIEQGPVGANSNADFNPDDPTFGAAVNVDYQVQTVGLSRTVTITYTSLGDQFVSQAAIDALEPLPQDGSYGVFFRVFITDDEWDGDSMTRSATASIFGDGQTMLDGNPFTSSSSFLAPGSHGFVDLNSPAEPGFFGSQLVMDQFVYEITYNLVPAPGALAAMGLLGLGAARRRR